MGQMTPPRPARRSPLARIATIVLLGVIGAAGIVAPYWWMKIRPRMQRLENPTPEAESPREIELRSDSLEIFDLVADLPGDPLGIAWNGSELVIGNRQKPWGFMRIRRKGDSFAVEKVPVIERRYRQTMDFWGVTWSGTTYIGHSNGAWFGSKHENVFTIHDPNTLQVVDWKPAPPDLGCLTFDGSHYWAATRKNTEETNEETFLWKLDASFNVVARFEPPSVGCQGLAWDGSHLWLADVFSDSLYVIDVSGEKPEVVHSQESGVSYLSGVAFDGKNIWVTEYDEKRIHRLKPKLVAEWKGEPQMVRPLLAGMIVVPATAEELATLEQRLRSDEWAERMHAENRLRELGRPVRFDRDQDSFAKREREDTAVFDWSAEMRDGSIYGSWQIHFGEDLFDRSESDGIVSIPKFARYEITVEGGTQRDPVKRTFEAEPGDNIRRDVLLASGLGAGKYEISLFLHVQYRTPDGTDRILNRSTTTLSVER